MDTVSMLWMPVVATAILIFIASSLIHMVFKWHNSDYRKLANEDDVRAAVRAGSPAPGLYVLPHCADMKDMAGEAMQKKFIEGPVALLTVKQSGAPGMGKALLLWYVLNLVIAAIAACLALGAYPGHANAQPAAHLGAIVTFLAYFGGSVQMAIWMGKPWGSVAKDLLDCIIFAVITGCVFAWLWP